MKTGKNRSNYAKTGRFLGIYFSSAAKFLPFFWPPPRGGGVAFGQNIYPCPVDEKKVLSQVRPILSFFRLSACSFFPFFCQFVCSWLTTIWWSDAVFLYWWRKLVHLNWPIYTQFGSKFGSGTFCDLVRCFCLFGRLFVRFLTYSAVFLSVCHFVCLWHYLLNRVVNPGKHDGNALQILHAFLC